MRNCFSVAFVINQSGGGIIIKETAEINGMNILYSSLPTDITKSVLDCYRIDIQDVITEYVCMCHENYGTVRDFESFQINFAGFLKHLRNLS